MEMLSSKPGLKRLTAEDHPENRPSTPDDSSGGDIKVRPIGWWRALFGMWLAGVVGSLFAVLMVAYPLGAGDTVAALCMIPLMLALIAIVNGWIAANLFLESGLDRHQGR